MAENNNLSLEEISSTINGTQLTDEEIDFLLQRLDELKTNNSVGQVERELIDFLVEQLNRLQQSSQEEEQRQSEENAVLENFGSREESNLKSLLQNKLGEFIVLNLMTGGGCCVVEGVLCKIERDFITLIDHRELIEVKLEVIAAIRETPNSFTDYHSSASKSEQAQKNYQDQYYLEQKKRIERELGQEVTEDNSTPKKEDDYSNQDKEFKVNKRKKSYTQLEDGKER
ncbi:hypothetical protein JCM16358_01770 [Halanaerocella petrolearia]